MINFITRVECVAEPYIVQDTNESYKSVKRLIQKLYSQSRRSTSWQFKVSIREKIKKLRRIRDDLAKLVGDL